MSRALVTGCAGFIGSHLSERLLALGWEVVGVDALTSYYDPATKQENLAGLLAAPGFRFDGRDLGRASDLHDLVDGVDTVWHLAGQPGVRASFGRGFTDYLHANVLSTQRLLEAAVDHDLHRFVYASSSSVYGDARRQPTTEDCELHPVSPYGVTKVATETLARSYFDLARVPVVGLRYFTVYGPRQRPDMAFSRFIAAGLEGRPICVHGSGQQVRDFTYVDDIVDATVAAGEFGHPGEAYNVGGGHPVCLTAAIECLAGALGRPLALEHLAAGRGDARATSADCSRCARDLGVQPHTPLAEGLRRQCEWAIARQDRALASREAILRRTVPLRDAAVAGA